jgi:hypothetical protein
MYINNLIKTIKTQSRVRIVKNFFGRISWRLGKILSSWLGIPNIASKLLNSTTLKHCFNEGTFLVLPIVPKYDQSSRKPCSRPSGTLLH